jgi:rhamnulokinase
VIKLKNFLSIDIGATSGKAFVISYNDKKLEVKEILRFPNIPVEINGFTYWNILGLYKSILEALKAAVKEHNAISVGIDTWGVDFGLLDENGHLLGLPLHYRNTFKWNVMEKTLEKVGKEWIFNRSPTQFQPFNTLYQIIAMRDHGFKVLDISHTLLGMPSLFVYFLTGKKFMEFTFATTTQMYNPTLRKWEEEIIKRFDIPQILPEIVEPATIVDEIDVGGKKINVTFPATHDTASAFACVNESNTLIISTGTWFLEGMIVKEPVKNALVMKYNFANEGCVDGRYRLLANLTGMWLIEKLRAEWGNMSYTIMIEMAKSAKPFTGMIDVDSKILQNPDDMEKAIVDECMNFSNKKISSREEIIRTALEGIALKTRFVKDALESVAKEKVERIRMLGGATRNELACQFISNATALPVETGPIEATAIGNALAQMVANGVIKLEERSNLVNRSFDLKTYKPNNRKDWEEAYEKFKEFLKVNI